MKTKPGLFSLLAKLGKDKRASGRRLLARLIRDEEGSYLLYMTLALPVLIGVGGLAGEASLLLYNHRTLQSAADAAAYSTAIEYSNNLTMTAAQLAPQAQAIVASYGFTVGTGNNQANVATPTITGPPYGGSNNNIAIQVSISRPQSTFFSSQWFPTLPNSVSAIAVITGLVSGSSFGGGNCLLVLGNTATGNNAANAIQVKGGGSVININAPNCGVFSDSNAGSTNNCASDSVSFGGNAKVVAGSFGSAGCISVGKNGITLPTGALTYTQNDGAISDPYAGLSNCSGSPTAQCVPTSSSPPPSGGCVPIPPSLNNKGFFTSSGTLCPGVYTGIGVDIPGCAGAQTPACTVTLSPGIYVLDCSKSTCPSTGNTTAEVLVKDGTLSDGTTSSTPGTGVTLVFTCSTCPGAPWPSNGIFVAALGNLSLSAPASAASDPATAGYVMMEGPNMPLNTAFDNQANPTAILNGTVWVPDGAFDWGGTPSTVGGLSCLQMVVNTMFFHGNSGFSSNGCTVSASGGSGGAGKAIGSVVTLVD